MACLPSLLVLLIGSVDLLAANDCDIYGTVGQDLVLPFVYNGLNLFHVLRWTHNKTIVFYRQLGRVSIGNATDVSLNGSLTLNNLQFSSSGDYQVDVLERKSKPAAKWSRRVCVIDRVPKPQLSSVCDFPASTLRLNCHVAETQGVEFTWAIDGKFLTSEKRQELNVSLTKMKAGMSFMCSVANAVSRENSDIVRHACTRSPATQVDNYCFRLETVQAVFAGGAGLLLLLLIIIITLCCRRQRHRPLEARDGEEVRMQNARTMQEQSSVNPDYETMLSSVKPQGQSSHYYSTVPQPEDEPANRLSHHPVAEGGERYSPVPKPRTKSPQTANMWTTKLWETTDYWLSGEICHFCKYCTY